MNSKEYTEDELTRLHEDLYGILAEIIRVCDKCHIPYFIIGGTAIGALYWEGIIPWDDDIDIGFTRENYDRFLRVAPQEMRKPYSLQWMGTDPKTPFYFAKVRKDNTLFVEKDFKDLPIHHGIYIDVFPFDKVPANAALQAAQRVLCNFLNCCFMGKDIWLWKYMRKCEIEKPHNRGIIPCFCNWLVDVCFSKRTIYNMLCKAQSIFNAFPMRDYNMVLMKRDQISVKSISHPQQMKFGPLTVTAPSDLETYLRHHYNNLRKVLPKEEQMNHRPYYLSFDTTQE